MIIFNACKHEFCFFLKGGGQNYVQLLFNNPFNIIYRDEKLDLAIFQDIKYLYARRTNYYFIRLEFRDK